MSIFQIEETIKLNSWNDIKNRPGYTSPIKPKKYNYSEIIAIYSFKDESALCGVSDCLQPHQQGFLVITSGENETNICEACGQRFFNVSFEKQKKILQDKAKIRKQKIRLNQVLEQDIIKKRVNELKKAPKGANWLYQVSTSFNNSYPIDLIAALKELATNKDDNNILTRLIDNQADSTQIENIEQFEGLSIFSSDIREELIGKILKPLLQLEKLTDDPNANASLARFCKWADGLDEQFVRVEELLKEGQDFFNKWNLERLKSIPLSESSTRFVRTTSWNVNKAIKNT